MYLCNCRCISPGKGSPFMQRHHTGVLVCSSSRAGWGCGSQVAGWEMQLRLAGLRSWGLAVRELPIPDALSQVSVGLQAQVWSSSPVGADLPSGSFLRASLSTALSGCCSQSQSTERLPTSLDTFLEFYAGKWGHYEADSLWAH